MTPTPNIDFAEKIKIIGARIREGRDTYAGRLDAWHQLGNVKGTFQTWKDILAAAGQNFEVVKQQLQFFGHNVEGWGTFRVDDTPVKGAEQQAIPMQINAEGGPRTIYLTFLGQVGKDYTVIQHTTGFELLDSLVGQIDGAHYETMGTLDFGRTVWGQVDPNISIRVGDDVSDVLLTFYTSHDGSRAAEVFETGVRAVCRNTIRLASLKRLGATLRVRHTRNAEKRVADWKTELAEIRGVALDMQEKLVWLAGRKVVKESLQAIMKRLFPPTRNDDGVEESSTKRDNILASILAKYEDNDGNAFPEQRGTPYALLNSITNYVDHDRASRGDNRAEAAVFGSSDRLKTSALEIIMEEAEKMPAMPQSVQVDWKELGFNVPQAVN